MVGLGSAFPSEAENFIYKAACASQHSGGVRAGRG